MAGGGGKGFLPNRPRPLGSFDTHARWVARNAKLSTSMILRKNRRLWTVYDTLHSPLFFREIVEIERVLPLMAAILIFSRTESNLGKSIKSTPAPSVHLKIKMAAINGKTRSISTITRKNRGLWTV